MEKRLARGLALMITVFGLLFCALAARILYLQANVATMLADQDVDVFQVYQPGPDSLSPKAAGAPARITVPALTGLSWNAAGAKAAAAGLVLEGSTDLAGTVVRQSPPPGATASQGDSVKVWLEVP
jgi:hypothetical protein